MRHLIEHDNPFAQRQFAWLANRVRMIQKLNDTPYPYTVKWETMYVKQAKKRWKFSNLIKSLLV